MNGEIHPIFFPHEKLILMNNVTIVVKEELREVFHNMNKLSVAFIIDLL